MHGAATRFDPAAYLAGRQTPVFFGSAISNFGVEELLRASRDMRRRRCHAWRGSGK